MFKSVAGQSPAQDEVILTEQVMTYWTNFAKTGNPNSDEQPGRCFLFFCAVF